MVRRIAEKNEGQCSGSQGLRHFVKRTEHYHENVSEDLVITYYVHSTVSSLGWSEGRMVLGKTSSVGRCANLHKSRVGWFGWLFWV